MAKCNIQIARRSNYLKKVKYVTKQHLFLLIILQVQYQLKQISCFFDHKVYTEETSLL